MDKSIKGTRTEQNLLKSFAGESQAKNRYEFFAKQAKKEGYEQISRIFQETANQEKEHATWLMRMIEEFDGGEEITLDGVSVPTVLGTTQENLKAAVAGENYEHTKMYPEFADVAEEEGFQEVADRLRSIAKAEQHHEERYNKILKELEAGTFFKKDKEVAWVCRECGYEYVGLEPPEKCPSCDHDRSYYELKCEAF